jgi:hypothetical protein
VNIQGTFRNHTLEVGLAPTQKPNRVPPNSGTAFFRITKFSVSPGYIEEFREHSGNIQEKFRENSGNTREVSTRGILTLFRVTETVVTRREVQIANELEYRAPTMSYIKGTLREHFAPFNRQSGNIHFLYPKYA